MISFLLKILSDKIVQNLLITYLTNSVQDKNTCVDEKLVTGVAMALANVDSGLQRKPTGPRKKK